MAPTTLVALRYMERFRCLGGDCEDNCCQHWTVQVDRAHFVELERVLRGPGDRERFARAFTLHPPAARTAEAYARINVDPETGRCPYLSADELCSLHLRFGDALLADVCSIYPRYVSQIGDRRELSGKLSCPEAARGALLSDDGLDLVEVDAAVAGRTPVYQRPLPHDAPFVDELRGTAVLLLDRAEYPPASRLYFVLVLVEAATPFLAGATRDLGRLSAVTDRLLRPATLDGLHAERCAGARPTARACQAVLRQVARLRPSVRAPLGALMDRIVDGYVADGALERDDDSLRPTARLPAIYAARRAALAPALAARADELLLHWAKLFCLRELHPRRASPHAWSLELVLRLATHGFLLRSEPQALGDGATLERRFIDLVYQTARAVEHGEDVLDRLMAGATELLPDLDAAAELLQI